jgi:hypothetical protein
MKEDWNQIKGDIHNTLTNLSNRVCKLYEERNGKANPVGSTLQVRVGSNGREPFYLFIYRTFDPWLEEGDPLVVGVTFNGLDQDGYICIRADIVGEETGRIHLEKDLPAVLEGTENVLQAVHSILQPTLESWAAPVAILLMRITNRPPKDIVRAMIQAQRL